MNATKVAGALIAGLALSLLPVGLQSNAFARAVENNSRWVELTNRLNESQSSADARWIELRDRLEARSAERAARVEAAQLGRALRNAAKFGKERVAASLIEAGADANATDPHGTTPLYLAAKYGHADVARILIEAGADVNAKNHEGSSAVVIAAVYGHDDVIRLLTGLEPNQPARARGHH